MQKVIANPQSIKVHSDQADYYDFRTPYIPKVFEVVCEELGITKESTVMDMGCGRGEVANILSRHAQHVYAIDGSKEMIDLATKRDGIEYQVVDLNTGNPSIKGKVDHIFFGRSIHWFPAETLDRFSSDLLADEGRVVVCSTQWTPVGDWGKVYFDTRQKFASPFQTKISMPDFTGRSNLNDAGFVQIKKITFSTLLKASVGFMIGHTFATAYLENLEKLKNLSVQFEAEMKRTLKTYEERREITMKVTTWAIIYGRSSLNNSKKAKPS